MGKKTSKSEAQRAAEYEARNREERGLVRCCVWVPEDAKDEIHAFARRARERAKRFRDTE